MSQQKNRLQVYTFIIGNALCKTCFALYIQCILDFPAPRLTGWVQQGVTFNYLV